MYFVNFLTIAFVSRAFLVAIFFFYGFASPRSHGEERQLIRPVMRDALLASGVLAIATSGDGKRMAVSGQASDLRFYDLTTFQRVRKFSSPKTRTYLDLEFSPDGKRLAAAATGTVHIWDTEKFAMRFEFDACWPIVFSRDGNQLLTTSRDSKEMTAWSLSTRQKAWSIPHMDRICAMSLSADNRYLATVTIDEPKLRIWDLKNMTLPPLVLPADTGKEMAKLDRRVDRIDFSKDAETLVMSGADVSYFANLKEKSVVHLGDSRMALSQSKSLLFSVGSSANTIQVWDAKTNKLLTQVTLDVELPIALPCVLNVTSDGKLLSIGDDSGNVIVMNIDSIKLPK